VFTKYKAEDIRKMGSDFLSLYKTFTSSETCQDITKTKPFANTEDIASERLTYEGKIYLRNQNLSDFEAENIAKEKRE